MADLSNVIATAIQARVPVIIMGGPGVGKTSTLYAIVKALGRDLRVIILSRHDPVDASGYPCPDFERGVVRMMPNETLWGGLKDSDVIFLDELTCAEGKLQAVMLQPLFENRVGNMQLPDVSWVAAANPAEIAAGGSDLEPPMANRLCHLEWQLDARRLIEGTLQGWPAPRVPTLPATWEANVEPTLSVVASFWQHQPHKIYAFPQDRAKAGGPWPSPRTWTMAGRLYAACDAAGLGDEDRLLAFSGCVGHGAAVEFLTWFRDLDLPDPEELLANPKKFKLPPRSDQQFAAFAAVVSAVIRNATNERNMAAWKILAAGAVQGAADVAGAAARSLGRLLRETKHLTEIPKRELEAFEPMLRLAGMLPGTPPVKPHS